MKPGENDVVVLTTPTGSNNPFCSPPYSFETTRSATRNNLDKPQSRGEAGSDDLKTMARKFAIASPLSETMGNTEVIFKRKRAMTEDCQIFGY